MLFLPLPSSSGPSPNPSSLFPKYFSSDENFSSSSLPLPQHRLLLILQLGLHIDWPPVSILGALTSMPQSNQRWRTPTHTLTIAVILSTHLIGLPKTLRTNDLCVSLLAFLPSLSSSLSPASSLRSSSLCLECDRCCSSGPLQVSLLAVLPCSKVHTHSPPVPPSPG